MGTSDEFVSTPSVTDVIVLDNAGAFTLRRANGFRYIFERVGVSSIWLATSFIDSQQNAYTFTYDDKNRLTMVGDASGRFLRITYQQLGIDNQGDTPLAVLGSAAPPEGQWTTIGSASTKAFRYLRYRGPDRAYGVVAEIEFLSPEGVPLSGTPFGSGSEPVPGFDFTKAFDADTATCFLSSIPTYDYTGIDLGVAAPVGSIQFFPRSGYAASMALGRFYGSNTLPATVTVISKVETSDGRSVNYEYETFDDPGLQQSWQTLREAHYGDGTSAAYTYAQVYPLTRPLMSLANDPRVMGPGTRLGWEYDNTLSNITGYVVRETNGVTGETMMSIDAPAHVEFANGGVMNFTVNHSTSRLDARTDSLGRRTSYTYDYGGYGYVTSMTDPLGRTTSYTVSVKRSTTGG